MTSKGSFKNAAGHETSCTVLRRGRNNTRIELADGTQLLVPTAVVSVDPSIPHVQDKSRIIPKTPLEQIYRRFRKAMGDRTTRFRSITSSLQGRHGPTRAAFLSELFDRSAAQASFYRNLEPFYNEDNRDEAASDDTDDFASNLVKRLHAAPSPLSVGSFNVRFVDYEVFPFRTTYGCNELGEPGTSAGSGGMDLLLASEKDSDVLPAIGEIKAQSEHVGPTFALIQALMYASQITTRNQADRLQRFYPEFFGASTAPRCDIFIILQDGPPKNQDDQDYAAAISEELMTTDLTRHIRSITIATCGSDNLRFSTICSFYSPK